MAWRFVQSTGEVFAGDGELIATGYSGFGAGRNDPTFEAIADQGPIPRGAYRIGAPQWVDKAGPHGPFVLPLIPDPTNTMYGRSGFLIHGDVKGRPGTASHGCIVMARAARERIAASGDNDLVVT